MKKLNIIFIALLLVSTIGMGVSASLGANKEVELDKDLVTFANANNLTDFIYRQYPYSNEQIKVCVYTMTNRSINCNLVESGNQVAINNAYDRIVRQYLIHEVGMKASRDRTTIPDVEGNITISEKVVIKP